MAKRGRKVGAVVKSTDLLAMEWVLKYPEAVPDTPERNKYKALEKDDPWKFQQLVDRRRDAFEKRKESKSAKAAVTVAKDEGTELIEDVILDLLQKAKEEAAKDGVNQVQL